jgi:hypothetical protein
MTRSAASSRVADAPGRAHPKEELVSALLVGYARVSTHDQDLTAQRDALAALGVSVERTYVDHGLTGTNRDRPGLREALAACRSGDTLVVTKLDRRARSLPDARDILEDLTTREVKLSIGGRAQRPVRRRALDCVPRHRARRPAPQPRERSVSAKPRWIGNASSRRHEYAAGEGLPPSMTKAAESRRPLTSRCSGCADDQSLLRDRHPDVLR